MMTYNIQHHYTERKNKQRILTILFWYGSGIGVAAISKSNFSQTFDISQTDFKQRGHAYLMQNQTQKSQHLLQQDFEQIEMDMWGDKKSSVILTGNVPSFPLGSSYVLYVHRAEQWHHSQIQTNTVITKFGAKSISAIQQIGNIPCWWNKKFV